MFPILVALFFHNGFYQMGRKKVRKFSSVEKTKIVLDLLKEELTLIELSSKYGVTTKTLQNWKHQFSDQRSQYTIHNHIQLLKNYGVKISMNGKGRSIDNVLIERFFRTIKYNCLFINDFKNIKEIKQGIKDYMHKYNYNRFHSSIKYQKPMNVYPTDLKNQYPKGGIIRKQSL
ncbi:Putative IS3 family transposase, ssgr IS150 [Cardinium endosymbiont cBtQ1 of Bemisia tabaci]|nr:integrase core domain-containing protein [Cardinium endosymbiont of Bemisia tabaci]CDG49653.1 Putative IS3 family transposase, ssgr IS150 [Cardinium endosymbiont cBtQ1 of Bemisia tabaci]